MPLSSRLYLTVGRPDHVAPRVVADVGVHVAYGPELPNAPADEALRDAGVVRLLEELIARSDFVRVTNSEITVIGEGSSAADLQRRCDLLRDLATTIEARWPQAADLHASPLEADLAALVARWGAGDDGKRSEMIGSASSPDLERLLELVVRRRREIERAVAVDSDLLWVLEAASEARRELDERTHAP